MLARRRFPLAGLAALAAFLAMRLPAVIATSWGRVAAAWPERDLGADAALAQVRGPEYVNALRRIRQVLPPDSEYLLLAGPGDMYSRSDLAPRRAIFGGERKDVAHDLTPAKLLSLPEWTIVPSLGPPGPRLIQTRAIAATDTIP